MRTIALWILFAAATATAQGPPVYHVDPAWPKRLPNKWSMQQIVDIYVDKDDHIWVLNRAGSALDGRSAELRRPVPGSLIPNYHVIADV